ncbi:MAG: hypothetical protein WBE94_18360, partial [Pseudolabrys sp.]
IERRSTEPHWAFQRRSPGHRSDHGRPLNDPAALERARTELRQGTGIVKVAKQVGLGVGTVHRLALELRSQPPV